MSPAHRGIVVVLVDFVGLWLCIAAVYKTSPGHYLTKCASARAR